MIAMPYTAFALVENDIPFNNSKLFILFFPGNCKLSISKNPLLTAILISFLVVMILPTSKLCAYSTNFASYSFTFHSYVPSLKNHQVPVSYTHVVVYKRPVVARTGVEPVTSG